MVLGFRYLSYSKNFLGNTKNSKAVRHIISKAQSRATLKYRRKTYNPLTIQLKKENEIITKKQRAKKELVLQKSSS